ncbi:transmembrane protein 25 isoform X1 [Chrysemys picta bellii]|uniref:transmembrane protein 25 isoform X1 n=1 Tax=Chrysemys picta bellii TaxID=8478 RepID=UPI0032B0FF64
MGLARNLAGCGAALSHVLLLLLHIEVLVHSGLGEPDPKINGQSLLVSTMQEDESRDFTCQVDSWQAVPMLTWYLNGKKQETNGSTVLTTLAEAFEQSSSTFTVTAQRADRELNCSLTDPASGKTSNASVLLNVQFKPEIMTMNAKYQEAKDPGLLMVLFVLVRANPPASITWIDQDGHVMMNTSDFLILDTKSYPWLTNHTVQVQLSSVAKNFSFTAANNVGITNSSILPPGLLDTRVELPLLAIIVGGALALGTLVCLNTLIICVVWRKGKKASGLSGPTPPPPSDSNNLKLSSVRLPRENMSLPSNLQLNDLTQEAKASRGDAGIQTERKDDALSEPENSLGLGNRGFGRFPMVGNIYKVSSMSSDEIWL